ncbi:death-associated protein kinase 1-like [Saccoglossus kowalevskii]
MPNICSRILKSKDTWLNKNLDDHGSGAQSEQFPVMRWDDYYKFVKKYIAPKIEEEFLKKATNYLHDIGEVLYVRNLGSSGSTKRQDIVVLKPQWLCNRIFGPMLATDIFLQFAKKFTKKKIYPRKDIDEVLGENADCDLLIELLKDFELLFLNPGSPEESYIIPGLLIEDMPEGQWERSASMKRYFGRRIRCKSKKDGFSPGLFPRLQTRIYQELTQHGRPPSGIWRNGIKFSYGIEGLLYMANDAINIIVRGRDDSEIGECYEVLEMVTRDIYDVLDVSCPGVDVEMCILSALSLHDHCKPELVHAYPLSKILEAEKLKIKVYDEEFGKEEEITTLLCPGFDRTVLNEMGEQTDVKWMLHPSRKKFVDLLEVKHPVGWDHRNMAQFMDIDYEKVMALQEHANNSNKRVTDLILDAWSENWAQKKRKFGNSTNVKGNNKYHVIFFESSFQNLKAIFQIDELAYRDDVKAVIEGMFRRLEISPGDPASDSEEDSDAYEE